MIKRKLALVIAILTLACFCCFLGSCKNNDETGEPSAEISTKEEVDTGDEKDPKEEPSSEDDSGGKEQVRYYSVIFYNEDGSVFEQTNVKKGEKVKTPDKTPKDSTKRKEFLGWSLLGDTTVYDFTAEDSGIVVSEMNFTAVFGEKKYTPVSK